VKPKSRPSADHNSLLYAVYEELLVGLGHKNFSSAELLSIAESLLGLSDDPNIGGVLPESRGSGYYGHEVDVAFDRMQWVIVETERLWEDDELRPEHDKLRRFENIANRWSV